MTIPNKTFVDGMHVHQRELFATFQHKIDRGVRIPQFFIEEWHRRARKTTAALNLGIRESCRVPRTKYGQILPTQVMARNIVWDDPNMLRLYLPDKKEMDWKLNEQKMLVTFANKSTYKIGGADDPNVWRGTDFTGVTIDEWSLIKETLWTEILRPVIAAALPPHLDMYDVFRWVNFIYTPQPIGSHAWMMFDDACCLSSGGELPVCGVSKKLKPNWYASRVDGELSGIIPDAQLRQMQQEVKEGKIPQAFYDQEIKCARVTQEEMTLISSVMLYELNRYKAEVMKTIQGNKRIVSIDPAWGGDVCQLMGLVNCGIELEKKILDKHRDTEIAMAAKVMMSELGTKNVIVDCVNDVGIAENLEDDVAGYNVIRFKSSEKATEKDSSQLQIRFANKRAEAYWYTSRLIAKYECGAITNQELLRGLPIASQYTTQVGSGRLLIIPKQKIKELLGRSPDPEDCYVMGCYGSQFVEDEEDIDSTVCITPAFIGRG